MTTHLPECWATDPSDPPAWCICDELRACEKRVLDAAGSLTHACPPSGSGIMPCCGRTPFDVPRDDRMTLEPSRVTCNAYEQGQRDALNAAVQRVESLADDMDASTEWCRDYEADKTGNTRNPRIWIREAVAAIKGEQE